MGSFISRPSQEPLGINTDPSQHYVVEKSELEGITDIRHLVETSELEEAWVFVQARDPQGAIRSLWYEVGEEESANRVVGNGYTFHKILRDLDTRGLNLKSWRWYHHHPKSLNKKFPIPADFVLDGDYLHFHKDPLLTNTTFRKTPNMESRIVTPRGVFALLWRHNNVSEKDVSSEDYQQELEENIDQALGFIKVYIKICENKPPGFCKDDWFIQYGLVLSNSLVEVKFLPYPIDKLPETISVSDSESRWVEWGFTLPLSIGAQWVHMDVGEGRVEGVGPNLGLGFGIAGAWQPQGFGAGIGLSVDYTAVESPDQIEDISENYQIIDYGLWGKLGYNFGSLGLYLQPGLGGRNTHSWRFDRKAFWLGGDGVASILDGGVSLAGGARFLVNGGQSYRAVFQLDVPSLVRSVEQ